MMVEDKNIDTILGIHFSGEQLSDEQEAILTAWILQHGEEYEQLSKIIQSSSEGKGGIDKEKAWKRIQPRLQSSRSFKWRKLSSFIAYAACVLLVVGVSLFWWKRSEDKPLLYANSQNILETILLPDSSCVTLYPDAEIKYLSDIADDERRVFLKGKAFFKVKRIREKAFVVENQIAEIRVLGTSFLVSDNGDKGTEVSVREGRVEVSTEQKKVVLGVNECASVRGQQIEKTLILYPAEVFKDQMKSFTYVDVPLRKVLNDVEKEFDVVIEIDEALLVNRVSTRLNVVYLKEILSELSYICNCSYSQQSDKKYRLYLPE